MEIAVAILIILNVMDLIRKRPAIAEHVRTAKDYARYLLEVRALTKAVENHEERLTERVAKLELSMRALKKVLHSSGITEDYEPS